MLPDLWWQGMPVPTERMYTYQRRYRQLLEGGFCTRSVDAIAGGVKSSRTLESLYTHTVCLTSHRYGPRLGEKSAHLC